MNCTAATMFWIIALFVALTNHTSLAQPSPQSSGTDVTSKLAQGQPLTWSNLDGRKFFALNTTSTGTWWRTYFDFSGGTTTVTLQGAQYNICRVANLEDFKRSLMLRAECPGNLPNVEMRRPGYVSIISKGRETISDSAMLDQELESDFNAWRRGRDKFRSDTQHFLAELKERTQAQAISPFPATTAPGIAAQGQPVLSAGTTGATAPSPSIATPPPSTTASTIPPATVPAPNFPNAAVSPPTSPGAVGQALRQAIQPQAPSQDKPALLNSTIPLPQVTQAPPASKAEDATRESACDERQTVGIFLKYPTWKGYRDRGLDFADLADRYVPTSKRRVVTDGTPGVAGGDQRDCLELVRLLENLVPAKTAAAAKAKSDAEKAAAAKAKQLADASAKAAQDWINYQKRSKTILEKVFNYSSFSDEEGSKSGYWTSGTEKSKACILTLYEGSSDPETLALRGVRASRTIDITKLNERGFRIKKEYVQIPNQRSELARMTGGGYWVWRFGDEKMNFSTLDEGQVLERLQKAWGLVFRECPGVKSEF